jgi:hypothetical protein
MSASQFHQKQFHIVEVNLPQRGYTDMWLGIFRVVSSRTAKKKDRYDVSLFCGNKGSVVYLGELKLKELPLSSASWRKTVALANYFSKRENMVNFFYRLFDGEFYP